MDEVTKQFSSADPFESWWPFIVALVVGIIMTIRTIMCGQSSPSTNVINNQIVIITGGSGGIGYEIAKELSTKRSAHIILACRDMEKATKSVNLIKKCKSDAMIECRFLDLKSFDCVRRFVRSIEKDFQHVDVLINNAGLIFNEKDKTVDGFETHLQVNYLAPFLLTQLLLPKLNLAEQGRVINTSAHAYSAGKMNEDDPLNVGTWAPAYHHRDAFAHSKLAIVLASRYMATVLKDSKITVNILTPGFVRGTDHLRRSPIMNALCAKVLTYPWMWIFMKNPYQGAQTAIYLATEPSLKSTSGIYFNDCEKTTVSELASDDKLAASLYVQTMKVLKLDSELSPPSQTIK